MREPDSIEKSITDLETDLLEIKNRQIIGGSSWIVYRNVVDDSAYDVTTILTGANQTQRYLITFTPNNPDQKAIAQLIPYFNILSGSGIDGMMSVNNTDTSWYYVVMTTTEAWTIQFKFVVLSSQSGTVTVTAL